MRTEHIITTIRYYITNEMWDELQKYYTTIFHSTEKKEYRINYEYIFQNIYLFVCNQKNEEMMNVLHHIYDGFGDIEKIALKPTLIYGKYLFKNSPYGRKNNI